MPTYEDWLRQPKFDVCGTPMSVTCYCSGACLQPPFECPARRTVLPAPLITRPLDSMNAHWFAKPRQRVKAWRAPNEDGAARP